MTDESNNVIERVARAMRPHVFDETLVTQWALDEREKMKRYAVVALEECHHAELVEALRYFAFDMRVFGATADQTTANATVIRARVEDARTLLAQIGGER